MAQKFEQFVTPEGEFRFPNLVKPDTGERLRELGYAATPSWKTGVILDPKFPEVVSLVARLEGIRDAHFDATVEKVKQKKGAAAAKKWQKADVFEMHTLKNGDELVETGKIVINVKCPCSYQQTDRQSGEKTTVAIDPPLIFDAAGKKDVSRTEIWGGTLGKVSGYIKPYDMNSSNKVGVSLRLQAAQVIKLNTAGERDAADFGFNAVANGYTAEVVEPTFDSVTADVDSDEDESMDGREF